MDASILNYTVNDNVGQFLENNKKIYINGKWIDSSSGNPLIFEDPLWEENSHVQQATKRILIKQSKQQEPHLIQVYGQICLIMKKEKLFGK